MCLCYFVLVFGKSKKNASIRFYSVLLPSVQLNFFNVICCNFVFCEGSFKFAEKNEDEILNWILANDVIYGVQRMSSNSALCSPTQQVSVLDSGDEIHRSRSAVDETNLVQNEAGSSISPEELRKQAANEKKKEI